MAQGIPIVSQAALALSTTETSNLVQQTYDYIGAGKLKIYAKASAATVLLNVFVNGTLICRRLPVLFTGTAGTIDTSANLVSDVNTLGGRIEVTAVATTGTPTVDLLVTYEGMPGIGKVIPRLLGR